LSDPPWESSFSLVNGLQHAARAIDAQGKFGQVWAESSL